MDNLIGKSEGADQLIDFSESILPLIQKKQELHMGRLDQMCEERQQIASEILEAQQDLQRTKAEAEQLH